MEESHGNASKRRRTEQGHVKSQSQDGIEDTMLLDEFDTVATVPAPVPMPKTPPRISREDEDEGDDTLATIPYVVKETPNKRYSSQLQSSYAARDMTSQRHSSQPQSSYTTQPTQALAQVQVQRSSSPLDVPRSVVQVAASSPVPPSPNLMQRPAAAGSVINRMAPPGTQFRPPRGARPAAAQTVPLKRPPPVDLTSDDEGPVYVKDSDEDDNYNRDLKPTVIKSRNGPATVASTQSSFGTSLQKFRLSTEKSGSTDSSFATASADNSQTGDPLANAYGSVSRAPRPQQKQRGPAKAMPILDISLDDITDFQMRRKVENMHQIIPRHSIAACYNALRLKKGNMDDAMDFLADSEEKPPEAIAILSDDEGELASQNNALPRKPKAKQQAETKQTIQQKYAARTGGVKASQIDEDLVIDHSPVAKKPRRRLVQGRKFHSPQGSPRVASPSPKILTSKQQPRAETPISLESDEEGFSEASVDPLLEGSLLKFLNECTIDELVDLAQTSSDKAEFVLSQKPFASLNQIRAIVKTQETKSGARRKTKPTPIGEKIVDDCEKMWTGFTAVDQLVQSCESMGRPVAAAMQNWGVNVYGNSTSGELEIVAIEDTKSDTSAKDSGIGSSPRSSPPSGDDEVSKTPKRTRGNFFSQPVSLAEGVVLKDYQVVGINWLSLLFKHRMSCILADDMGLGKTCQVISFIAHLRETGVQGPHIIVVPSSVLENWLREFERFCPDISVMPYHAGKNERAQLMEDILEDTPEVIITTYVIAKKQEDRAFFKSLKPTCCIFDEGHMLKNPKSEQYKQLMRIPCEFRLLLTGTPLQNNLGELIALLGFMMPTIFKEHQDDLQAIFGLKATTSDDDNQHAALLSAQRIARAKSMMTPFILRRKKHQVLKDIPEKHHHVHYCDMSESQAKKYKELTDRYRDIVRRRAAGVRVSVNENTNVMMDLRKAAIHPMLFRRLFTEQTLRRVSTACLAEEQFSQSDPDIVYEELNPASDMELHRWCAKHPSTRRYMLKDDPWMDSGKVSALVELLTQYRKNGDRVLLFSQFTMVLDVLEEVLETVDIKFARLDGSLDINLRQDLIDKFYRDESILVFMLSTKAGGAGINLACANKVIIFDSSFNPQDDVQAENRAHRVGQTREVDVVRLVTKGTVEEQIFALGQTKLALDQRIAGDAPTEDAAAKKLENAGKQEVERLLAEELGNDEA